MKTRKKRNYSLRRQEKEVSERKTKLKDKVQNSLNIFEREHKKLKKMIGSEAENFQSDKSTLAMLRSLLAMTIDLIPIAEEKYRKDSSEFSSRSIINLTTQARELAADIKNLKDIESQVEHINVEIFQHYLRQITQHLITETFHLKKEIGLQIKNKSTKNRLMSLLNDKLKNHGNYLSTLAFAMHDTLNKYM